MEVDDNGRPGTYWRFLLSITVPAPRLHRTKADPAIRAGLLKSCYYRLHRLLKT
jgi:hypothetical protein